MLAPIVIKVSLHRNASATTMEKVTRRVSGPARWTPHFPVGHVRTWPEQGNAVPLGLRRDVIQGLLCALHTVAQGQEEQDHADGQEDMAQAGDTGNHRRRFLTEHGQ